MSFRDPWERVLLEEQYDRMERELPPELPYVRRDQCWSCQYPEPMLSMDSRETWTICLGCGAEKKGSQRIPWNAPNPNARMLKACQTAMRLGCYHPTVRDRLANLDPNKGLFVQKPNQGNTP